MIKETSWIPFKHPQTNLQVQFKVSQNWLEGVLKAYATEDASTVINEKETYIRGRIDHLNEYLYEDEEFAFNIYEKAESENVLLSVK